MEPLTLALMGYPLSIFANFTYDQLKNASQKIDINPLKNLFIKAFYTSAEYHNKYFDDYAKEVTNSLIEAVKNDEERLLIIFSKHSNDFRSFLSSMKNKEFQKKITEEIIVEYSLDSIKDKELAGLIVNDCLNYYLYAFFNQMNEKEGIQAILMECLKIDTIVDLLKQIDSQAVTKNDFDELRKIVFLNYFNENKEAKKKLDDYDIYLKNKFKYLELRGFSPKISGKEVQMELLDIFVPLEIKIEPSIVPNIEEETSLMQRSLEIDSSKSKEGKKKDPLTSILEHRHLVILGDPGSGKSTLLKYLAIQITHLRNSEHLFSNTIPLYIRISDYADYFKKTKKTIYEFITDHYDKQYQHIFKESFEFSNLLLLIDGLDEITDTPLRIKVTEQLMDLMARYPFIQYVVTSRIVGYQESKLGSNFKHFKLMPFSLAEIKLFSKHWYDCIAQHTDKDYDYSDEQASSLYSSISRSPSVIRLATNPLLMTIIAMIHYKGKKLPNKRVELYDISTETFLEYWVQLRMSDESQLKDKNEIIEILAPIAYEIHQNKSNALIEEKEFEESFLLNFRNIHTNTLDEDAKRECKEFIGFLRQQAGFFYEKGVDDEGNRYYGFIHLTFEEYLAAIEVVSKWNEGEFYLNYYIFNPRWIEIIRLAASQLQLSNKGRAGRTKSTQFVKDILFVEDPFPEAFRPLQLVCLILSDDVNITDKFLNEILDKIIEVLSKMDFRELVISFSELLKELLYSDYRKAFVDRFVKELITDNSILLKNLIYIFVSNSGDREINKIIFSIFNKNQKINKTIYQIQWQNFPFQNTKVYKKSFKDYLFYIKSQNDNYKLNKALNNFLITEDIYSIRNHNKFIDILDQFFDTDLFDDFLIIYLNYLLFRYHHNIFYNKSNEISHKEIDEMFRKIPNRYSSYVLVKNLMKSMKNINWVQFDNPLNVNRISTMFEIEHYSVIFSIFNKQIPILTFFSRSFDNIFHDSFSITDIPSYINSLELKFSKFDIEIIEMNMYRILLHEVDISKNILNQSIINRYGNKYMEIMIKLEGDSLKYFDNEHIHPPIRLFTYYLIKEPIPPKLMEDSIVYFRESSSEEKKRVFPILYSTLNPFKLVSSQPYNIARYMF